ncbi:hypothetical protein [Pseudomonas syringae]|uniref:hypothetical protein n=1 Tax=Pseudomonas syringae TaxID=317 RepID=UPI001F235B35|nr:hypothetical protein [Pseudomonas syringae]
MNTVEVFQEKVSTCATFCDEACRARLKNQCYTLSAREAALKQYAAENANELHQRIKRFDGNLLFHGQTSRYGEVGSRANGTPFDRTGCMPHIATDHLNAEIGKECSRNAYKFMITELPAGYA